MMHMLIYNNMEENRCESLSKTETGEQILQNRSLVSRNVMSVIHYSENMNIKWKKYL